MEEHVPLRVLYIMMHPTINASDDKFYKLLEHCNTFDEIFFTLQL